MSRSLPDLSACADEPIRIPGAIQPHGRMLVLSADDLRLLAWSENWPDPENALAVIDSLSLDPASLLPGEAPMLVGTIEHGSQRFDVTAHRSGNMLVLEFETGTARSTAPPPIYALARHFLPKLQSARSVEELAMLAASEIKALTGFGRSLVYSFDSEGHGEVLAEEIDEGYESYARHRFPASDIPPQARQLYLVNQIRLIGDANYQAVALRCADPHFDPKSIDLSYASLRSVSPVHLEFMRNMGTLGSMSVSIVVRGKLWGLISCHNHEPRLLDFQTRVACEHLGRLLALQIEAKEEKQEVSTRLELRQLTLEIVSHLAESDATLQRIVAEPGPLLRLARATGAAVVLDEECWMVGDTPSREQILALAAWVGNAGGEVFHSDRIAEAHPAAADLKHVASGMLAISISQVHRHIILWFRPEMVQTIQWAGDPRKEVRSDDGRIHPRRSFASWKEEVGGRSMPWSQSEIAGVLELRQALIGVVLRRAQEMAEVAMELGRVNKELEAFSYTVSHDLRAPMRHIVGYVDLVLDMESKQLSERAQRYLGHVKDASAYAGHLVDALLDFSRMGRSAIKRGKVPMETLIEDLVREMKHQEPERRIEWEVQHPLPVLWADPLLIQVALRNLLSNAVKYTRTRDVARIRIAPISTPEGDGIEVSDNGVGFPMKFVGKLFGVFQRLHQAEEFEGTGIGLANVRRIVERHGGTIWAHAEVDQGATFSFTLPPRSTDDGTHRSRKENGKPQES